MKILLISLLILFLSVSSLNAEDIPKEQRSADVKTDQVYLNNSIELANSGASRGRRNVSTGSGGIVYVSGNILFSEVIKNIVQLFVWLTQLSIITLFGDILQIT